MACEVTERHRLFPCLQRAPSGLMGARRDCVFTGTAGGWRMWVGLRRVRVPLASAPAAERGGVVGAGRTRCPWLTGVTGGVSAAEAGTVSAMRDLNEKTAMVRPGGMRRRLAIRLLRRDAVAASLYRPDRRLAAPMRLVRKAARWLIAGLGSVPPGGVRDASGAGDYRGEKVAEILALGGSGFGLRFLRTNSYDGGGVQSLAGVVAGRRFWRRTGSANSAGDGHAHRGGASASGHAGERRWFQRHWTGRGWSSPGVRTLTTAGPRGLASFSADAEAACGFAVATPGTRY